MGLDHAFKRQLMNTVQRSVSVLVLLISVGPESVETLLIQSINGHLVRTGERVEIFS